MDIRSKPTFVLLGCCLLFDNMFICPSMCLTHLFALVWLSLILLLFACFLYLFVISIACLLAFFLVYCMYMHGVRMLGVRARPPRHEQKGQRCKQEDANLTRAMFSRLDGLASLGMAMSILHFLYLARPYPWNVGNVWFTFLLYVVALCMMYVYLYMLVYWWLCTLYDELLWLYERPSLIMRALNLMVWVCTQGIYCRCIVMPYYVHNHRDVIISIHLTVWHWFPCVCDTHWHALCFEGLRLVLVRACWHAP